MSSFIPSPSHFNSVEDKFSTLVRFGSDFYIPSKLSTILPICYDQKNNTDAAIQKEVKGIFDTLREITVLCVTLQYKHHYKDGLEKEIALQTHYAKSTTETKSLTITGLYKALNCIRYQIEIEHLKELRALTQQEENALVFLEVMENYLAHFIASSTNDYNSSNWSIDL